MSNSFFITEYLIPCVTAELHCTLPCVVQPRFLLKYLSTRQTRKGNYLVHTGVIFVLWTRSRGGVLFVPPPPAQLIAM